MAEIDNNVLKWISDEYYDLNGSHYDTLDQFPSPLEFAKLLRIGRPVKFLETAAPKAISRWNPEYLAQTMGKGLISVALTPNGRADAITAGPNERLYFAEPYIEPMTMADFLQKLQSGNGSEVAYLQSQNGNLYTPDPEGQSEFKALLPDVPKDIKFATDAVGSFPDAVNLWIGDSKSVTSIHSDPYENIYTVIKGSKTFVLFPPTESWALEERIYPHATYERDLSTLQLALVPSPSSQPPVRWSSIIDPTASDSLSPSAHPITVTINAGESLYLPAGWWHYVRQTEMTIAVNYWYDTESRGIGWVWLRLLRGGEKEVLLANEGDEFADDVESDELDEEELDEQVEDAEEK